MAKIVLVVDDSATDLKRASDMLSKAGFSVLTATDGDKGYEIAKEKSPALILMDVVMPGTNGFQATRRIHSDPITKAIPVLMFTNKNNDSDKAWASRNGAVGYLHKSLTDEAMVKAILAHVKP